MKRLEAIGLHAIMRNLKINKVTDASVKMNLVRDVMALNDEAEKYQEFAETLNGMKADDADKTLNKYAKEEVDIELHKFDEKTLAQVLDSNPELAVGAMAAVTKFFT